MSCDILNSPGASIAYDVDGTPPFTTLGDVTNISGPGITVESKDITSLTTSDAWREKCPSFKDGGQVTFDTYFTKAKLTVLIDRINSTTPTIYWRLVFPQLSTESSPSYWQFRAFIVSLNTEVPEEDPITNPVTLEITGEPEFVEGTDA